MIITQEPIVNYVAVDERTKSAMCDKKDAEDLGMLKIDMLGLTQLSIFERTLVLADLAEEDETTRRISMKDGKRIVDFFTALPLDDQAAFDVINKRQYSGIFQFNGRAPQSLANSIHTNHVEDLISMVALARPGPMVSGGANAWVERKLGNDEITYPHPLFEPMMRNTLGVVMYQEQVMQIGRDIGDLSWDDVTQLRKAMSKSLGKEYFDRYGDRWKANAIKKGVPEDITTKIWDDLCAYGSWAFNRSHSVAYGIVAYWSCWLKAHYPAEFAAATLDAESDQTKQLKLLRELKAEGFEYAPIDVNRSEERWTISDGKLIGPLTSIKGIGPAAVNQIKEARKNNAALRPSLVKLLANPVTQIDSLYPIKDAVARIFPTGLADGANIVTPPSDIGTIDPTGRYQHGVVVIAVAEKIVPRDENEAIKVAQRGGEVKTGQTASLNLFMRDDSGEILCKIGVRNYTGLEGDKWAEQTRAGKTLFAIKGSVPADFRMLWVNQIRYLGELDRLPKIEGKNETQEEISGPAGSDAAADGPIHSKPGPVEVRKRKPAASTRKKKVQRKAHKAGPRQLRLQGTESRSRVQGKKQTKAKT
jgi:hypothetical protein